MVAVDATYPKCLTTNRPEELSLFGEFCNDVLKTENGSPMELYEGEKVFLTPYFRGITESLIIIPKKNGKSTLMAALALFHLCTTPDAECIIVASSRDQAAILLRQVQGFIRRSPYLTARLQVNRREVNYEALGGRIRILASDADTADGAIPTLVLVDELHRHKSADLYGVLRDGLGPLNGQLIAISTAGEDQGSFLGGIRRDMLAKPGLQRIGAYTYACSDVMAFHEFALAPDADRSDMKLVKLANPAPWQTIAKLKNRFESPSMRDWQWARFACGVWLAGENSAIGPKEWAKCAMSGLYIPDSTPGVFIGIDFGWRWDTTAMVPIWQPEGTEQIHVNRPTVITPPRDGTATDELEIWARFLELYERWPKELTVVLDPNASGEQFAQRVVRELPEVRVVEHSQMPRPMALAAQRLSHYIGSQLLHHPDDEELNAHILGAAAKTVGESWRLVKMESGLPIDAAVALAMAVSVLHGDEEEDDGVYTW